MWTFCTALKAEEFLHLNIMMNIINWTVMKDTKSTCYYYYFFVRLFICLIFLSLFVPSLYMLLFSVLIIIIIICSSYIVMIYFSLRVFSLLFLVPLCISRVANARFILTTTNLVNNNMPCNFSVCSLKVPRTKLRNWNKPRH